MKELRDAILKWHKENRRSLPWREAQTPYHVWISEIMLQQTRIEAVIPYYIRFLQEFPTIESVAKADEEKLMKAWEGLGYYSRIRNIHKAAKLLLLSYHGEMPKEYDAIRSLPGIGDYTAGAIGSLCFYLPTPAIDGNVLRVLSRTQNDSRNILLPIVKKDYTQKLIEVYPEGEDAKFFTESLMELGETICTPSKNPECEICPLKNICKANLYHTVDTLPVRDKKKERKKENYTILLILDKMGHYLIRKRPATGLLASLYEPISLPGSKSEKDVESFLNGLGFFHYSLTKLPDAKHVFTHIEWNMQGYLVKLQGHCPCVSYTWATKEEIGMKYPIASAYKKYKDAMLKS